MSHELDFSRKLTADANYEMAVKSLAKVECKARLYEADAEGMSDLALLLRDKTSGSLRDECVRLHEIAQQCIVQHRAERAEGRPVLRHEAGQTGGGVSGRAVVLSFCVGLAATVVLAAVARFARCPDSHGALDQGGGIRLWVMFGLAAAVSFGLATALGISWFGQSSRASIAVGCIGGVAAFLFSAFCLTVLAYEIGTQHCPG